MDGLILSPWREEMIPALAKYADNPQIAANLRDIFPSPYTLADAEWFVHDCMSRDGEDAIFRAIVLDGEAVGSVSVCRGADVYRRSGELGYWLAEPFWGRGYATWAVRKICCEAFAALDLLRIYAEPCASNSGSRRVLEKAGFTLEGTLRHSVYKNGQILDSCIYGLLRT